MWTAAGVGLPEEETRRLAIGRGCGFVHLKFGFPYFVIWAVGERRGLAASCKKGSSRSGKAERRAMCQIKPDLNFVGGPHSGWQRLEKEDKMLGRLVLPLFCIRNIPSLKVQVETDFEFLFQLSAARENTPSTSRVPSIFEVGPTSVQYVQPRRNKKCICWVYSCMYPSKLHHYRI